MASFILSVIGYTTVSGMVGDKPSFLFILGDESVNFLPVCLRI